MQSDLLLLRDALVNDLNILAFFYWQSITVQDDYIFEKSLRGHLHETNYDLANYNKS